jgi:cbb3-type cytochrome oxidase subunit 3
LTTPGDPHDQISRIDVRLRISALWIAVLFIFSYVDLFSLYRPDFRADLGNGKVSVFDVNQTFLFFVTLYIIIPSLMVYLTLVMPRHLNRIVNITAAGLYGLTIIGSAVGEWNYFILGSLIEAILLAVVVHHSWTWPRTWPEHTTRPTNR